MLRGRGKEKFSAIDNNDNDNRLIGNSILLVKYTSKYYLVFSTINITRDKIFAVFAPAHAADIY